MYPVYWLVTFLSAPILRLILKKRLSKGKESQSRYLEKASVIKKARPPGTLIWVHGASVGEAQSALILVNKITQSYPNINVLMTTGTLTSATLMEKKLPPNAFHQFYPLDHPQWVQKFIQHWQPDAVLWMESELWPNMLSAIKDAQIPAALINARMSEKSFQTWKKIPSLANKTISTFNRILCQTPTDQGYYNALGAADTLVTDNLKYSATPLSCDQDDLETLRKSITDRPVWLYASTHDGEEQIACELHRKLAKEIPALLTIIVPRHPERRDEIRSTCSTDDLNLKFRGENKAPPSNTDQIYIADTLGELGLFYSVSPVACIGRSLSNDGGGGHNPIEAAQQNTAVIHGKNIQNLQDIYDEMDNENAAICVDTPQDLYDTIRELLLNKDKLKEAQQKALIFSRKKVGVIDVVMTELFPILYKLQNNGKISVNIDKTSNDAA